MKKNRERLPYNKNLLKRERIDDLLTKSLDNSATFVVASSGYGKTQAVASWAATLECPLTWVNLSAFDNNMNHFLGNFADSIVEMPEVAEVLKKVQITSDPDSRQQFMVELSQKLYTYERNVLVIDNYEVIKNEYVLDFVKYLLNAKIDNLCIVVISNDKLTFKEGQSRKFALQTCIGANDLKFTFSEAKVFFETKGLYFSDEKIRDIVDETDGWAIALMLFALTTLDNHKRSESSTDKKTLLDIAFQLFELKFNANFEKNTQERFVELSMFDGFTREIINLLNTEEDNVPSDIIEKSMFVTYDHEQHKYYFHTLFKEFLKSKLKLIGREKTNNTCQLVGDYYYKNEDYFEAMECFVYIKDYERMVDCTHEILKLKANKINARRAIKKLESIPSEYRRLDLRIQPILGICHLLIESYDIAYKLLRSASYNHKDVSEDRLQKDVHLAIGIIEFINNDPSCTVNFKLCEGIDLNDGIIKVDNLFHFLSTVSIFLYDSWLDTEYGTLESTLELVKTSIGYINAISNNAFKGVDDLYSAKILFVKGELDEALNYTTKVAVKTVKDGHKLIFIDSFFLRMQIFTFKGDFSEVKKLYRIIRDNYNLDDAYSLISMLKLIDNWVFSRFGDFDHELEEYSANRIQFYKDTQGIMSKDLVVHAYMLTRKKDYYDAIGVITSMEEDMHCYREQWMSTLYGKINKAVCYYGLNQKDKAYFYLYEAYQMTYKNNIIIPFLEFGSSMRNLMLNIHNYKEYEFDKEWVETIRKKSSSYAKHLSYIRKKMMADVDRKVDVGLKLSKKEREVLKYLSQGFTIQEIAQELYISTSTTKYHISNIYQKFGVVNRSEAIHFATIHKLI